MVNDLYIWLVVSTYPSEKYESVGMMTFPAEWKNNSNVPNHQPVIHEIPLIPGFFQPCAAKTPQHWPPPLVTPATSPEGPPPAVG